MLRIMNHLVDDATVYILTSGPDDIVEFVKDTRGFLVDACCDDGWDDPILRGDHLVHLTSEAKQ